MLLCSHSPPAFTVCLPRMTVKLSRMSVRQKTSSMAGSRKNGWPKRKAKDVGLFTEPIFVSGTEVGSVALRGRFSRAYVKCASLSLVPEIVLNQLVLIAWIFEGPSMPLAVVL